MTEKILICEKCKEHLPNDNAVLTEHTAKAHDGSPTDYIFFRHL